MKKAILPIFIITLYSTIFCMENPALKCYINNRALQLMLEGDEGPQNLINPRKEHNLEFTITYKDPQRLDYEFDFKHCDKNVLKKNILNLLNIERQGIYSPELLHAEIFSQELLHATSKTQSNNFLGDNLTPLIQFMAKRPQQRNELFWCVRNRDNIDDIKNFMDHPNNGYMLNMYNCEQINILHLAIQCNRAQWVNALLQMGSNPNSINNAGDSPLHIAIQKKADISIVKMLLHYGANPEILNNNETPFTLACKRKNPAIKQAFEPYGYFFFSSLCPYGNPHDLLKNNKRYFDQLAQEPLGSHKQKLAITTIEKILEYNKLISNPSYISQKNNSNQSKRFISDTPYGLILHNASKQQYEEFFGKKTLDTVITTITEIKKRQDALTSAAKNSNNQKLIATLRSHATDHDLQYTLLKCCARKKNDIGVNLLLDMQSGIII